jgi:hypothetical protein
MAYAPCLPQIFLLEATLLGAVGGDDLVVGVTPVLGISPSLSGTCRLL